MGLFDRFKKQDCEICGKEVGMFGYKKLEDGEICKECVKKLSPWFDDRRHSTVAQIKEQLAYRAKNEEELANFTVSKIIGEAYKMYIEEVNGVPTRFFVTDAQNYMEATPDIINFRDVLSCFTDLEAREEEMKRDDGKGNRVGYNPPRFKVHYNFYMEMAIDNNPYFQKIRFYVNTGVVTLETVGSTGLFGGSIFSSKAVPLTSSISDTRNRQRYHEYETMCQQIEEAVARSKMSAAPAAAGAPKFCPECGAPAAGSKFCVQCGKQLQG